MARKTSGPKLLNTSRMRAHSPHATNINEPVFSAKVTDLGNSGEAIVEHPQGMKVFVPGAWAGETIKVRIDSVKKHFAKGQLLEVLQACPQRRTAPCLAHGHKPAHCGGCPWMFVDYEAQCQAKQKRVELALKHTAPNCRVQPIIPAPQELGYRVRAQLKSDGSKLGYVANGQRALVSVKQCPVLSEHNQNTLRDLVATLPNPAWKPKQSKHRWTTLDIDESTNVGSVSVNKRLPFQQANAEQNRKMKRWISDKLQNIKGKRKALELFAGSGNFTRVLAQAGFKEVVAIEAVQEAIDKLEGLKLKGVSAFTADLFEEQACNKALRAHNDAEVLLLDPPRDGMKLKNGLFGKHSKITDVLYISCDLATFIRDTKDFMSNGFELIELQPLDLMPQTAHVELMAHFHK